MKQVLENQTVRLATVAAGLVTVLALVTQVAGWQRRDSLWKQRMERDVDEIKGMFRWRTADRWHRAEMREWAEQLEDGNPELTVPRVDGIETKGVLE